MDTRSAKSWSLKEKPDEVKGKIRLRCNEKDCVSSVYSVEIVEAHPYKAEVEVRMTSTAEPIGNFVDTNTQIENLPAVGMKGSFEGRGSLLGIGTV